jgi:hypothetical protein
MANTVMTIRIEPNLLAALRRRAKQRGRSVSAEVIELIRRGVEPLRGAPHRNTMGMFAGFEAPELADLKKARRQISARLLSRHRST